MLNLTRLLTFLLTSARSRRSEVWTFGWGPKFRHRIILSGNGVYGTFGLKVIKDGRAEERGLLWFADFQVGCFWSYSVALLAAPQNYAEVQWAIISSVGILRLSSRYVTHTVI